ncbi:MAG: DJ-1/PfpI family protein [Herbaspirillum sp.]|nr:DJ-1/PfpI family protein [Herbaspirillum sp.]
MRDSSAPSKATLKRRNIVIALHDKAKLLDVTGPLQVFNDAKLPDNSPAYEVFLASAHGGQITTDSCVSIPSHRLDEVMDNDVDTLLVVGGDPALIPAETASLRSCLQHYVERPRRVGSICVAAFILAELGVLDGQQAATHWGVCDKLQREYPAVTVMPDAIFVKSGRVWTSAGVSAGIDMALTMVEEDIGHAAALSIARQLVLFLKRGSGQSQFSVELRRQVNDARGRFENLHHWIRQNLGGDLSVEAMASVANMSPRNFARVYRQETGESPAHAVEQIRVDVARRLLESTLDSIQTVAHHVGFGDDERMRRAFLKAYGMPPLDYRTRFGRMQD